MCHGGWVGPDDAVASTSQVTASEIRQSLKTSASLPLELRTAVQAYTEVMEGFTTAKLINILTKRVRCPN